MLEEAFVATIEDVLDRVDGLRRDAADRVQAQFSSVADLAAASTEQLTAIKGVGQVMADRIRTAAQAAQIPGSRRLVERVVDTAVGGARTVIEHTPEPARRIIDRAAEPAKKLVDRVVKRDG